MPLAQHTCTSHKITMLLKPNENVSDLQVSLFDDRVRPTIL